VELAGNERGEGAEAWPETGQFSICVEKVGGTKQSQKLLYTA